MGDCKWERSLSVWGEAESITHPRGAESAGGGGISEGAGGVWGIVSGAKFSVVKTIESARCTKNNK